SMNPINCTYYIISFFFQAEDGIRDRNVTGVQTCALPIFYQYVNAEHIDIKEKPINTKRNFLIKARFEDSIKDISYVIKLINYIRSEERRVVKLYIVLGMKMN